MQTHPQKDALMDADNGLSAPPPWTLEEALERLQQIASSLEGDAPLESAVAMYEEGMALARECLERLQVLELRIQEVSLKD